MRAAFLMRYPICAMCHREAAGVLDHIKPHRGNQELYWDQRNWQALCTNCHGIKTARETWPATHAPANPTGSLVVLMGAPGAGKSTWAQQYRNVVSTDILRSRPEFVDAVFRGAYSEIARLLERGECVVFDTTAEHLTTRRRALEIARRYGVRAELMVFRTDVDACLTRQAARKDPVPAAVVRRVHAHIAEQLPRLEREGWASVTVVP